MTAAMAMKSWVASRLSVTESRTNGPSSCAGAIAVLAAPASAAAAKPSKADKREAQQECRDLRGTTDATREAFKAQCKNFGACVSQKAKEAKAERKQAKTNASQ